jgi:predicted Zn-dependent peptidase
MRSLTKLSIQILAIVVLGLSCLTGPLLAESSDNALQILEDGVSKVTLKNGLRILIYRRGVAPVFSGVISVRVGGSDEVSGQTGISHMFEHIAFKGTSSIGTKDFGREKKLLARLEKLVIASDYGAGLSDEQGQEWEQIQEALEKLWVNNGFGRIYSQRGASGLNAGTGVELTNYYVSFPRPAFEFWCSVETDRIVNTVPRQFYRERDVVMEERRMRVEDNPGGKLYEQLLGVSFLVHPYQNPTIGYRSDIGRLTASATMEFKQRYYVPNNMVVAVVGDVDEERDREVLEEYFGTIPTGPKPPRPTAVEPPQQGERRIVLRDDASPELLIAYHKPVYPDPDDAAISLMLEILVGSRISPMYSKLVKESRIAASVSHFEAPGQLYPNLVVFNVVPRSPHSNLEVLESFDRIVEEFKVRGVSQQDLDTAKRKVAKAYLNGLKSNMSLAQMLAVSEVLYDDWRAVMDWYQQVMKVSIADVERVAKRYFQHDNRVVGRLENRR